MHATTTTNNVFILCVIQLILPCFQHSIILNSCVALFFMCCLKAGRRYSDRSILLYPGAGGGGGCDIPCWCIVLNGADHTPVYTKITKPAMDLNVFFLVGGASFFLITYFRGRYLKNRVCVSCYVHARKMMGHFVFAGAPSKQYSDRPQEGAQTKTNVGGPTSRH